MNDAGAEVSSQSRYFPEPQTPSPQRKPSFKNYAANGAAVTRADVARLAEVAAASVPRFSEPRTKAKQTIARALAETGQARTWNLMIDVIAQTGQYRRRMPSRTLTLAISLSEGEKRYWLHIALDRDSGTVLGTQLEEVFE